MAMKLRPENLIDFYKSGHKPMYPDGTELVFSNWTARSASHFTIPGTDKAVFVGLQGMVKWLIIDTWNEEFFNVPLATILKRYKRRMDTSLGEGAVPTDHIEAMHKLGYLPLEIKALPEGSLVPLRVPMITVKNTVKGYGWLTNYFEDMMSAEGWKPTTNATIAYRYRQLMESYARQTGSPLAFCDWQGHDFSMRGMSGVHDASSAGVGHLLSFLGTDTVPAIDYVDNYYNGESTFVGGSVPATEHSVMCMGGEETEIQTFRRLLKLYPTGVLSVVSDTWDFWKVITEMAVELKPEILARTPNALGLAKTVFRPDSGDPVKIICGEDILSTEKIGSTGDDLVRVIKGICPPTKIDNANGLITVSTKKEVIVRRENVYYRCMLSWKEGETTPYVTYEVTQVTPAQKGAVECLWDIFGGTVNEAGYKVLNERVGLIYGDSITYERAHRILEGLKQKGFASCNIVFGIGSYTYQHNTRDSLGFAMKATYGEVNGVGRELFKNPVTDSGVKKSAKGLLRVEKDAKGEFILKDQQTWEQEAGGELRTVFKDGKLLIDEDFATIRRRVGFINM